MINPVMENIPTHIAIIMDGNGRWARMRNLPRLIGHRQGVKTVKRIIKSCTGLGVRYLTLYAFSTENWKRPKIEVQGLMRLLREFLRKEIKEMDRDNVRLMTIGDISKLPKFARQELEIAKQTLNDNKGLTVILALNYGARLEIIDAIKRLSKDCMSGICALENLDESIFSRYLYTTGLPDPDLLIRTSGQMRLSNFLLWQTSYTELYFTDKLWPDFDEKDLTLAIEDYSKRKRRFGGL